jgi:predicted small secreted protein
MKKSSLFCALICLALAACSNTFKGMGQDIERAGEAIQKAVK